MDDKDTDQMSADTEEDTNTDNAASAGDGASEVVAALTESTAVASTDSEDITGTEKSPTADTAADVAADVDNGALDIESASKAVEEDEDEEDSEDYLVEEGEIAGDYLEQLLDVLDFDGDIDLDVEGDRAIVSIDGGDDLAKLVGRKGEVLDALQELTRLAVQQSTGERSKLMLDVAGWRSNRRSELSTLGVEASRRVLESGEREELAPMTPFERKIVHDAVAKIDGVESESTGVEPSRRVVVLKS